MRASQLNALFCGPPWGLGLSTRRSHNQPMTYTLEYWQDGGWYVGRLKEVAGVMSQGETLEELEANIRDAYQLMRDTEPAPTSTPVQTREIEV